MANPFLDIAPNGDETQIDNPFLPIAPGEQTQADNPFAALAPPRPLSAIELSQADALSKSVGPIRLENVTARDIEQGTSGLEQPLFDPITAFAGGFGVGAFLAKKAGTSLLAATGRGLLSGTVGAGTDLPISVAAEQVGEIDERLALPFALLVGVFSGATLERAIERKVLKTLSKVGAAGDIAKVSQDTVTQVKDFIKQGKPEKADDLLKKAQDAITLTVPVKTKAEKSILELAQESQLPKKKGFERTAEDLVIEQAERAGTKIPTTPTEPISGQKVVNQPVEARTATERSPVTEPSPASGEARVQTPDGEHIIPGRLSAEAAETTQELANKFAASDIDAKEIGKMVDSINVDRLDTEDDVKKLMKVISDEISPRINEARRGKISLEETKRMAIRSGITEQTLIKRKAGELLNAEESTAASMINTASAKRLLNSMQRVNQGGTDEDILELILNLERHKTIQAAESGIATEIGRALSARRIIKDAEQKGVKNLRIIIDALGGREVTEEVARKLAMIDPDDVGSLNQFIQKIGKATTTDKVFEVWVNALLSNPLTHARNFTSNTLTFLNQFPEHAVAGGFDALRSAFTGKPRDRFAGEAAAAVFGISQGLKVGVRKMLWSFRTGLPSDAQAKLETRIFRSIKGKKGEIIRIPGRFLIAADEFFKGLNYSTEIHALAFRDATKKGLRGKAKSDRIAAIINDPTKEIDDIARAKMLNRVFQKPLTGLFKDIAKARLREGPASIAFRFIVPFVRTPINIAKYTLERTPIGFIRIAGQQLTEKPFEAGEVAERLAKATVGTAIGAVAYQYALEGKITGSGPTDRNQRDALYRTGWRPYSIKIGDKYYGYGSLEPIGSIFGMASDLAEGANTLSDGEYKELALKMAKSLAKNTTNKTFLRGLGNALEAMEDPDRYAGAWIESFGSTIVPQIVAGAARASDDSFRRTEGMGEYIQSKIPFMSQDLLPERTIWGDPIPRGEGSFLRQFLSPIPVSTARGTEADREMVRMGMGIGKPQPVINNIKLTPKEYDDLMILAGSRAKKMIDKLVASKSYRNMPDKIKEKQIRSRYDTAVKIEKTKLFPIIRKKRIESDKFGPQN